MFREKIRSVFNENKDQFCLGKKKRSENTDRFWDFIKIRSENTNRVWD